jgi:hypothetical protein
MEQLNLSPAIEMRCRNVVSTVVLTSRNFFLTSSNPIISIRSSSGLLCAPSYFFENSQSAWAPLDESVSLDGAVDFDRAEAVVLAFAACSAASAFSLFC